ncbi:MAG: sigma-70 family RNA polymerase sigma factor [Clostridia bacterium]|nr:sigma-70 family RNA polymerase sigma factor [Clostridia bacterium]
MYETKREDIIAAQNGNEEKMEEILKGNNGLTWSIVKRFIGRGYEVEDLYQIGCMGFIKAIKRFDTSFDVKISTYAVPYILGEIKRFIRDDGLIKVSRSIKELSMKINELQQEYIKKEGKEISINLLAEKLNVTKEEIAVAIDSSRTIESINDDTNKDDGPSKIEIIETGIDEASMITDKIFLKELIDSLNSREKEIIVLRYYKEKTQTEVAKILGITQVQVSRIEKKILSSMRNKLIA